MLWCWSLLLLLVDRLFVGLALAPISWRRHTRVRGLVVVVGTERHSKQSSRSLARSIAHSFSFCRCLIPPVLCISISVVSVWPCACLYTGEKHGGGRVSCIFEIFERRASFCWVPIGSPQCLPFRLTWFRGVFKWLCYYDEFVSPHTQTSSYEKYIIYSFYIFYVVRFVRSVITRLWRAYVWIGSVPVRCKKNYINRF